MSLSSGVTVLWIDPGDMTGLAYYHPSTPAAMIDEFPFQVACAHIETICKIDRDRLLIGWERYDIDPSRPQTHAHDAIGVIGVARYFASFYGCHILPPAAPDDRKVATPKMLKHLGWWRPGKDDAQSAAQHLLAWLLRSGHAGVSEGIATLYQ